MAAFSSARVVSLEASSTKIISYGRPAKAAAISRARGTAAPDSLCTGTTTEMSGAAVSGGAAAASVIAAL
ncbi:hypothetical protein QE389_002246 [Brevundimonas sp. SORGH_AS 993]|nr:hypothetical protein [Brevundimonas sp. SORGH_AS_0993]